MKNFSFLVLTALALTLVACGNKGEGGGSSKTRFTSDPYKVQTLEGLIHLQSPVAEVKGVQYQISQQSFQAVSMGVQQAQSQNIQPIVQNGVYKYKAKITGYIGNSGYMQQGNYPQVPQQGTQQLNITQVVIYR